MKTLSGTKTSYNAQAAVDEQFNVIIANDVVSEASDVGQLEKMVDQSIENIGRKMEQVSADSGYSSGENLDRLENKQIDAYIPDREYQSNIRKGKDPKDAPFHKENFTYNETEDIYICPAALWPIIRSARRKSLCVFTNVAIVKDVLLVYCVPQIKMGERSLVILMRKN